MLRRVGCLTADQADPVERVARALLIECVEECGSNTIDCVDECMDLVELALGL